MSTKLMFGAAIAFILLGLYVVAIVFAILVALCLAQAGCTTYSDSSITSGITLVMTLVGGLVSALVVAELAVTEPGEQPGARILDKDLSQPAQNAVKIASFAYLTVWLVIGLIAFIVGVMIYEGRVQQLTDVGKSWLGLAIAAAYAYLGVKPPTAPPAGK